MSTKTYQIWHDRAWPGRDLITEMTGETPQFPGDYVHVANVQADRPEKAVGLTVDRGGIPDDPRPWSPWERNEGVEALARRARDTVPGDVVVGPEGRAYSVTENGVVEFGVALGPVHVVDGSRAADTPEDDKVSTPADGLAMEGQRPMPTKEQMDRVVNAIQTLREEYAFKRVDEEHVALAPYGRATEDGYFFWDELVPAHRRDALARGIDWDGFNASERADVIMRVLDDEPAIAWMDGIKYYNPWEDFDRPLTQKQHAAYLADIAASYGMTVEEMDDYYERMEADDDAEIEDEADLPLPAPGDDGSAGGAESRDDVRSWYERSPASTGRQVYRPGFLGRFDHGNHWTA
jgi:hypothetical protein